MTTIIPEPSRPRYQPAIPRTSYEAWRVSYQSSEQAARAAFADVCRITTQRDELLAALKRLEGYLWPEAKALIARMEEGK